MSEYRKPDPAKAAQLPINSKVRLSMNSCEKQLVETLCKDFILAARQRNIKVQGPKRMPTRTLRVTTRKSPCGQGTNTYEKFQLRMYKRVIDLYMNEEQLKDIGVFCVFDKDVSVEVFVQQLGEKA